MATRALGIDLETQNTGAAGGDLRLLSRVLADAELIIRFSEYLSCELMRSPST